MIGPMLGPLFDHLWQSTLFAGVTGLLTVMLRANSAGVRFWLWFAASVKFLLPFAALTTLSALWLAPSLPAISASAMSALEPAAEPFATSALFLVPAEPAVARFDPVPFILLIWVLGIGAVAGHRVIRLSRLKRLCEDATDMPMAAPIKVKRIAAALEPGLAGIWRPVILLPEGIETRLSPDEMNAILAHELCHLRRRDNLLAAIHMLVETLFWFHPLVWWLGKRLGEERERACDEMVLAQGCSREIYAGSILNVCKLYLQSPLYCAAGVSGGDLRKRVGAIIENRLIKPLGTMKTATLVTTAAIAVALPLVAAMILPPDAFAFTRTSASPGTEKALRHLILSWQRRQPDFAALTPAMAQAFRRAREQVQGDIDQAGPLKSVTFQGVSPEGWDIYSVAFANALTIWNVAPLTTDSRIPTLGIHRAFRRRDRSGPSPGTEAALRRQIEGWEHHQPAFDEMSPVMRANMKRQYAMGHQFFDALGALKSIAFQRVSPNGWDMYDTVFENGRVDFSIGPLTADGKVDYLGLSPAFDHSGNGPSSGTEASLRCYIAAFEKGSPDYAAMTPAMAALVHLDLTGTRAQFRSWGGFKALRFRTVTSGGLNVYDVLFAHGHGVYQVAPLTKDGKLQWLIYDAV